MARPPFGRPRPPRTSPFDPRTLAISLAAHAAAALAVWLAPAPSPRAPAFSVPAAPTESVSYVDVAEWGAMATDPRATLPPPSAAAEPALGASAADSALLRVRGGGGAAGPAPSFPGRVPVGVPTLPGAPAAGGAAPEGGGAPAGAAGRRSGPGRLGPELGDPRLVVTPSALPEPVLSNQERYRQHLERRIQAINDSIADTQRPADWTIRDRNGNRWGLDENGLVIGGRSVPTPRPTYGRPARDREDEARRERDQRAEIDRQAETTERERDLRERQRAIRERVDREREERRRAEGGGANP